MASNQLSHRKIVSILRDISILNKQVSSFNYGQMSSFNADNSTTFPTIFVEPGPVNVSSTGNGYSEEVSEFNIYCLDRINKGDSNYQEIISDMKFILQSLLGEIDGHQYFRELGLALDGDQIMDPYLEQTDENVNGWVWTLGLRQAFRYTPCNTPMNPITGFTVSLNSNIVEYRMMGATGPQGPIGPTGPQGPEGPTVVSSDFGNIAELGSDGYIYVPNVPATQSYDDGSDSVKSVYVATTTALTRTPVYDNGVSGVGATLTGSSNGTMGTIDGVVMNSSRLGERVLVQNQASQLQNGIYDITTVGSSTQSYVLTRSVDSDETDEFDSQVVTPVFGTNNKGRLFGQTTNQPTVGSSSIVYTQTNSIWISQQTSGTQTNYQIPIYTGTARQLTKGTSRFKYNYSTNYITINNGSVLFPSSNSSGLLSNNGSGVLSWAPQPLQTYYTTTTTDSTTTTIFTFSAGVVTGVIPIESHITGYSGTSSIYLKLNKTIFNNSGTLSDVSVDSSYITSTFTAATSDIIYSGNVISVRVTGEIGKTINWKMSLIKYNN